MTHNPYCRRIQNILLMGLMSAVWLVIAAGCSAPAERDHARELAQFDITDPSKSEIQDYQVYIDSFIERTSSSEDEIFDALVFTHINARKLPTDLAMIEVLVGIEEYLTETEEENNRRQLAQDVDFISVSTKWLTLRAE